VAGDIGLAKTGVLAKFPEAIRYHQSADALEG
jgi:hypothetical protein